MDTRPIETPNDGEWIERYRLTRSFTDRICTPLETDDYQLQSITETSPPKWHISHVSWFFETFILNEFYRGYRPFHPQFNYLFNSYYETVGRMHPRPKRGMLSRPTVGQVYEYRDYVDRHMLDLLATLGPHNREDVLYRLELGLNHEQQHQELLFMDIKHNFFVNPLKPAYLPATPVECPAPQPRRWESFPGGIHELGATGNRFCFDNETPRHRVLLQDFRLADGLVTNGEYLEFMEDGGYSSPRLWLADGWSRIHDADWRHPLYWVYDEDRWLEFTLSGLRTLNPREPVCHLSYYEANAYATWAGKRLPTEAELEQALAAKPVEGNFADSHRLHPVPTSDGGQWYGDLWNWTASAYGPYPGYRPPVGAIGEYNGKFMANQIVLRGGSCATPAGHTRASYRNFFYPHDRWAFTGLRLAEDA